MQVSKLRPLLELPVISKYVCRTAAVASEIVKKKEDIPLKSWREIPGPRGLPILGKMHHFFFGGVLKNLNGLEMTTKLRDTYGPIVRLDAMLGREPMILIFDAESISQILRGENQFPIRPGLQTLEYYRHNLRKGAKPGKPTGLITDHNETWKQFRSTVNHVLLQPKTIRLYRSAIDEVAKDMVERMKSQRDDKNMLKGKFDQEMNLWSLESIGVVSLGCRLGCLDPNLSKDSPAQKLIKCVREIFIVTDKLDVKPTIWKFVSTPNFKRAMRLYEELETLAKYFINRAIDEMKNKNKSEEEKGILEKLLEINEEFAIIMALDMLFAGVDTASNTIAATLYLLGANQEKQNKLREELKKKSKDEKRPYLRACLKESLRMMPVVSGNMRVTTKEYNLLGYKIPPKTKIFFGHQEMSLMETQFPRPLEYLPERWLVDQEDPLYYKNAHPFAYMPFGFGIRSCIGQRIAELEMNTFIARVIENFQVEWFGPPPKVHQMSINYVKPPFNFIFNDVNEK